MKNLIQPYLNYYKNINPKLTDDELEFIKDEISILRFKKKQIYIHENDVQKSIGFIHTGLIRSYFIDTNGKEINNAFFSENEFVTDYLSFLKQEKTKYSFQCLEDTTIISISYETVKQAFNQSKNFANFGRKIAEWALEIRTKKYESFLFENAEERYLSFARENKSIINRISLSQLSSYLGIERQTLSRIRSKILSQK